MTTTTAELRKLGAAAYTAGKTRAPITCPEVRTELAGRPVGDPYVLEVMRAWGAGYTAAADLAAQSVLAELDTLAGL